MTPEEIRQRGLEVLRHELGPAGMLRFLQQFETGSGDYAKERRAWVDGASLDDVRALAAKKPAKRKR